MLTRGLGVGGSLPAGGFGAWTGALVAAVLRRFRTWRVELELRALKVLP